MLTLPLLPKLPCTSSAPFTTKRPGAHAGVGDGVGEAVGQGVGCAVGAAVGEAVGEAVGDAVGAAVGATLGAALGIATHSVKPVTPFVHIPEAQASQLAYSSPSWYRPDGQ